MIGVEGKIWILIDRMLRTIISEILTKIFFLNVIKWTQGHLKKVANFNLALSDRCDMTVNAGFVYLNNELVKDWVYSFRLVV